MLHNLSVMITCFQQQPDCPHLVILCSCESEDGREGEKTRGGWREEGEKREEEGGGRKKGGRRREEGGGRREEGEGRREGEIRKGGRREEEGGRRKEEGGRREEYIVYCSTR